MGKSILLISFLVLLFTSCEKSISFSPRDAGSVLVVEAIIENGQPPRVVLSNSLSFFDKITPGILESSFVHNAEIDISNGVLTHRLKEYAVPAPNGYTLYYYTIDSSSLATAFTGALNSGYSLAIKSGGKTYTAQTSIPPLMKKIDSLWWEKAPKPEDSTKAVLKAKVTDPPGLGNYIRYFTRSNEEPFYPGLNSVFDDQIVDGKTYSVQVERGVNRNESIDFNNYAFFYRGDTVTVKFCNIDKATFDFWRTMEYSYSSVGNPFSSPTRVLGNIGGGALGYFGGYAVQYISLVIPR